MPHYKKIPTTVHELFEYHLNPPAGMEYMSSDIKEHLPTLLDYAAHMDVRNIVEMGTRWVVSTIPLILGNPQQVFSIDLTHPDEGQWADRAEGKLDTLGKHCVQEDIDFRFIEADSREIEINSSTDLLFLDTLHDYAQLKIELEKHSKNVQKWIIMHDTESFKYKDESTGKGKGLWPAIEEFLANTPEWELYCHYYNNNGLTVLKRKEYMHWRLPEFTAAPTPLDEAIEAPVINPNT